MGIDVDTSIQRIDNGLDFRDEFAPTGFLDGIVDAESARMAVDKVEAIEDMLRLADEYGKYASQFCLMEADTYIKIASIDGSEDGLPSTKRKMVGWIRSKSDSDIADILEEVSSGVRIKVIWSRECKPDRQQMVIDDCKRISDIIVSEAIEKGRTKLTLGRFFEESKYRRSLDSQTAKAFVESTRDRLLKRNICGLGDSDGTYISPVVCDRNEVCQIVGTRLGSVMRDLMSIKEICVNGGYVVPSDAIEQIVEAARGINGDFA